ncbi:MAG: AAA family ATPase [Candidatus Hydrogenedentes bacterium]|nr:AAA family ATPase [Candidatus Hydrogenedentota bacterium]
MRLGKLWLDGYGRFAQREVALHPGLQLIVGPNEQGKTTLRGFIADMLYGQKRSDSQRVYDETHELRRPWANVEAYGGRLLYHLDDGREIEISRSFDRKRESIQVFDRTNAREITHDFPKLRNRESTFADAHLGLTKSVFLSTATISHMTLDGLGDDDALAQIRERLLSLADSGEEEHSAEAALESIEAYAAEIGRPTARTRPLPSARARLAELDRELDAARTLHGELEASTRRQHDLRDEVKGLAAERAALEKEMDSLGAHDRAQRLREAETLENQIQQATARCFGLGDAREFPLEQQHDFQRSENVAATARAAVQRSEAERAELQKQIEAELERLGPAAIEERSEIAESTESRLTELESRIQVLHQRLEESQGALATAEKRLETAQVDLAALPDFSKLPPDPIEWLSGLASSYRVTLKNYDEEQAKLGRLLDEAARKDAELAAPRRLFGDRNDFMNEARDYELSSRVFDEQMSSLTSGIEGNKNAREENSGLTRESLLLMLLSAVGVILFAGVAHYWSKPAVLIPAGLSAVAAIYFAVMTAANRISATRAAAQIAAAEAKIVTLREEDTARRVRMEQLMLDAGCVTIRELEAQYDRYREGLADLAARREALAEQKQKTVEEEHHFTQFILRLRETLVTVGEEITDPAQVPDAAGRAMSRYQEFRDAKRRVNESKEQGAFFRSECDKLNRELETRLKAERELSLEVRRVMRENGFADECKHTGALSALRAYRLRTAQQKQKRGRIEVLQEKAVALDRRLEAEEKDLAKQEEVLTRYLRAAGAETPEQWHELADRAELYRQAWDERTELREKLALVLRDDTIENLREVVNSADVEGAEPERSAAELKTSIGAVNESLEARRQEMHEIEIALTQRSAGVRAISEIEEERAEVAARVAQLELELDAAAYAAAIVEDVARGRHARIAPRLAALASQHLDEITGGAYRELLLSRDMRISVRIPHNQHMDENPERRLSQGTVDQIYLALRLSLVQCLSENAETIPMLLDDPFANYDDARLERALRLLARIGETTQILVFTCRDDVARAAEATGAPILQL